LAEAQADLAREGVDTARDAEREKIKTAQDAVKDRIEAQQREEEDANQRRKQSLERDQEAERSKLKARLDRLEKQKQAAKDDGDEDIKRLRESVEAERTASEDRIAATRQRFEDDQQILDDRRREEDRYRQDQREAQDRFRDDERAEQDKALAVQLAAVNATLEQERKDTETHFNGPNGTITQLRKAIEASELLYSRRLAAARVSFEAERKAAERVYTNPEGDGLLQLLETARRTEMAALDQSKEDWQEWQERVSEAIKKALADLDEFIEGAGRADAAASAAIQAAAGSKESGDITDVTGWLSEALDEADAPKSWLNDLIKLVSLESSGDPRAINPKKVGNENATGLLQTLPSTFNRYKKSGRGNIFNPVDNAIAAIRYIKATYGSPSAIPGLRSGKFKGYDAGGMIHEPVIGRGVRSGQSYAFAERGPEYLIGRRATSMMGSGPGSASMGAWMSQAHPGGSGGSYTEGDINVSGIGLNEVAAEIERRQNKRQLLRGVRGIVRGW
jgi:hypothetical protein